MGSGLKDEDLDEQFKLQQEILAARRNHINFKSLHEKYAKEDKEHVSDIFSLGETRTIKEESEFQQEKTSKNTGFKFPWDLKP